MMVYFKKQIYITGARARTESEKEVRWSKTDIKHRPSNSLQRETYLLISYVSPTCKKKKRRFFFCLTTIFDLATSIFSRYIVYNPVRAHLKTYTFCFGLPPQMYNFWNYPTRFYYLASRWLGP